MPSRRSFQITRLRSFVSVRATGSLPKDRASICSSSVVAPFRHHVEGAAYGETKVGQLYADTRSCFIGSTNILNITSIIPYHSTFLPALANSSRQIRNIGVRPPSPGAFSIYVSETQKFFAIGETLVEAATSPLTVVKNRRVATPAMTYLQTPCARTAHDLSDTEAERLLAEAGVLLKDIRASHMRPSPELLSDFWSRLNAAWVVIVRPER